MQLQIEKYPDARVIDIEDALNEAAQQDLVGQTHQLISVNAPKWLHIKQMATKLVCPKPKFYKLD